ncbi:MAG: alpha-amylase family glycosyl hydrolase [Luteolibacter sp.]
MRSPSPSPKTNRPVIYQLMVRLFGNTNETRKPHGTLAENGCGKFADVTVTALKSLRNMGFTHVWLTGALEQASGTAYPNRPADDPDILKGIAGSPYAIRDYFDVCPDYAVDPTKRLQEFKALLKRCKDQGLRVIIDFIPNHVARSYQSDVRPELSFGKDDDVHTFFSRDNHFYYLRKTDQGNGPPLRLPTAHFPGCDGIFEGETEYGRVTGNNSVTWQPSLHDWYETVKLNYGHDFTTGSITSGLPGPDADPADVPKTWRTMDQILAYWQEMGVGGFRVDMAHMVPMEFWRWAVKRARHRQPDVFFCAEAYDNDPAKLTPNNIFKELIAAGFDAVYDDPLYDILEGIYDADKWTNDIDRLFFDGGYFHQSLRYVENHDEVRVSNPNVWGGHGMKVGKPASAVAFGIGRGPLMLYNGQEVGEPAIGSEGFAGDNSRTTIFDYWCMPEFAKWVNGGKYDGGRLSPEQLELREWYAKLIQVTSAPAFTHGEFYGLNHANAGNPLFGRTNDETWSGKWLYAFLRHDPRSGQSFLVIVNFHPDLELKHIRVEIPVHAWSFMKRCADRLWKFKDRLTDSAPLIWDGELTVSSMAPCGVLMLEILE